MLGKTLARGAVHRVLAPLRDAADSAMHGTCAQVRQFYTAPTLIRALEALDNKWVGKHDRSSLQVLGTVGEPINPRAWQWFFEVGISSSAGTNLMLQTIRQTSIGKSSRGVDSAKSGSQLSILQ